MIRYPTYRPKNISSEQTVAHMEISEPQIEPEDWVCEGYIEIYAPNASAFTFLPAGLLVTDLGRSTRFIPSQYIGYSSIFETRLEDVWDNND